MADTTRWEAVYWMCPRCDGVLEPKDSPDLDTDIDTAEDTRYTRSTGADETVVVCLDCGREFDVRFEAREVADE